MRDFAARERVQRAQEEILAGSLIEADRASRAGLVRVERGAGAFRVTFPAAKDRWAETQPIIAELKGIPGRRYSPFDKAWSVPLTGADSVEALAAAYGAEIEDLAVAAGFSPDAAVRIAELERQLAERELYIAGLEQELGIREGAAA